MLELFNESVFHSRCDLIIIPFSAGGTISESFLIELEKNDIVPNFSNTRYKLGDIIIQQVTHEYLKYIVYACTVERNQSNYSAIRKIGLDLGNEILKLEVNEINSPILGSGAGGLNHFDSLNIFRAAFYENAPNNVILNFSVIDEYYYSSLKNQYFDIDIPSSRLAFEASMKVIGQYEIFENIRSKREYHFELALEKFKEFERFQPDEHAFFSKLLKKFNSSQLTFTEFLTTANNSVEEVIFLTLCGELIAYIDHKASFKHLWNRYEDKRILAHSNVRQHHWLTNLLKYKHQGNLNNIAKSVKNALIYLSNPLQNVTMLSEKHRSQVFEKLLLKYYRDNDSIRYLFESFESFGITTLNPLNAGFLYTVILYSPEIKPLWNDDLSKSVITFSEENLPGFEQLASKLIFENLKTKSRILDLGNCGITNLKSFPELFDCIHLETLILSNEWAEFENGKWKERTSQNSGPKNLLTELPDEIQNFKNLKRLVCGGDWRDGDNWDRWGIKTVSNVFRLKELEYLNVSNNEIKILFGINRLTKLRVLHANNNHISTLPDLRLTELEEIYLSNNRISNISFLPKQKSKLHTIDLHANKIKDLSNLKELIAEINISNTKWELGTINIAKNPLEQPPMEFIELGKEAILRYFKYTSSGKNYINKEIKIILVGNSGVGKSTLAKYLDDEKDFDIPHPPTHWMVEKEILSKNIIDRITGKCLIRLFDFGGHDYFHDTHHLFFSKNTIYILLWDTETNRMQPRDLSKSDISSNDESFSDQTQDYPIEYWLESVKYFVKDSVEASNFEFDTNKEDSYSGAMIVVQNKVNSLREITHLNHQELTKKNKYPFVNDFINISLKPQKRNLDHFDNILTELLNSTEIIGQVLPDFYGPVKESIKTYTGNPILSFNEFHTYCTSLIGRNISTDDAYDLADYLKKVGVIIYIGESRPNKIYIDKKWVINNVYKALNGVRQKNGVFDLKHIIRETETNEQQAQSLVMIMLEFKIIVSHPYEEKYIAPLYLPQLPDKKINIFISKDNKPYRRLEFSGFIHKSIVLDFFHEFGQNIIKNNSPSGSDTYYFWKDALVIKDPSGDSVVMIQFINGTKEGNSHIDIISLRDESKFRFIKGIVEALKKICEKYDFEEMVTLNGIDFVSLSILETNAKNSKLVFSEVRKSDLMENSKNKDEIKLFQLKDFEKFITNDIRKKKVVISYSKKDLALVHDFVRYLRPLMAQNLIDEPWYCTLQHPAVEWDEKIQSKFKDADIVFFMISEYFYSTQYIIEKEIKTTINRYNDGDNVKIVPIILEHYDWSRPGEWDLQKFSALPYQAKPISDFGNPKIAWHAVSASIKMMIEKDLDPAKSDLISREIQEIYERQVHGKLDRNF